MTRSSPPKSTLVDLNGRHFRYRVDVDGGRVWLEDAETKFQWQWLDEENPKDETPDPQRVPRRVFLTVLEHFLASGTAESSTVRVEFEAVGTAAGPIQLVVPVTLEIAGWTVERTFVLQTIALDECELVRARVSDMRATLVGIESRLAAVEDRTAERLKAKRAIDANLTRGLTALAALSALLAVAATLLKLPLLAVTAVLALCSVVGSTLVVLAD